MSDQRDAARYRWLRERIANGDSTYVAEHVTSTDELDAYCDAGLGGDKREPGGNRCIVIVSPCGHPLSAAKNTGTPSWQNRWTCSVCGQNFSR